MIDLRCPFAKSRPEVQCTTPKKNLPWPFENTLRGGQKFQPPRLMPRQSFLLTEVVI